MYLSNVTCMSYVTFKKHINEIHNTTKWRQIWFEVQEEGHTLNISLHVSWLYKAHYLSFPCTQVFFIQSSFPSIPVFFLSADFLARGLPAGELLNKAFLYTAGVYPSSLS